MPLFGSVDEALKFNASLKELYLASNSISNPGASALAEAVKRNTGLQELFVDRNFIGDEGVQELAEALKFNDRLKELNLQSNSISDSGARMLLEALTSNSSLTELYLDNNAGISQDLMQEIEALITTNKGRPIILQVTTVPSKSSETDEDNGLDVAVTKMSGEQVFDQPLQPETKLREVAMKVSELCRVPVAKLRWVLPGPRTVGTESLDELLMQLLQGGPR